MNFVESYKEFALEFSKVTHTQTILPNWFTGLDGLDQYFSSRAEYPTWTPAKKRLFESFLGLFSQNSAPQEFWQYLEFTNEVGEVELVLPWYLMSLNDMRSSLYMLAETSAVMGEGAKSPEANSDLRLRSRVSAEGLLPFVKDGSGSFHCIDLEPGSKGQIGQIVVSHLSGEVSFLAESLNEYFSTIASEIKTGNFEINDCEEEYRFQAGEKSLAPKPNTRAAELFNW